MDHSENDRRFCVYLLRDSEHNIRYVGSGTKNRANNIQHCSRSNDFKDIVSLGGYTEIIKSNLTKAESKEIEYMLIKEYISKGYTLLNKTTKEENSVLKYEELSTVFRLDDKSPTKLVWNIDKIKTNGRLCSKARCGFKAGCVATKDRVSTLIFNGKTLPVHRILWVLYNRMDLNPTTVINHIDGDHTNNSKSNLEAVSQQINILKTVNKNSKNETGIIGVIFSSNHGKEKSNVTAYYNDAHGQQVLKSFSIRKYGELHAIKKAIAWRESNLNANYKPEDVSNIINNMYRNFYLYVCEKYQIQFDIE